MMQLCLSILLSTSRTFPSSPDPSINLFSVGRLSVDKLDKFVLDHMDPCSPTTKPSSCVFQLLAPAALWPQNNFQCQSAATFFLDKWMDVFGVFFIIHQEHFCKGWEEICREDESANIDLQEQQWCSVLFIILSSVWAANTINNCSAFAAILLTPLIPLF